MSPAVVGLILFVLVVAADAGGLLADLALLLAGRPTVTALVWADPALGVPVVLFQLLAPAGLALHFYTRRC